MTFEEFAATRLPAVLRFAAVLAGDRATAEDLAQEVLIRAHSRWDKIGRLDRPECYVRKMVLNEFLSWRRRSWRLIAAGDAAARDLAEPDHAVRHAEREALLGEIAKLPGRQRAVLVLRYYEGCGDAEIAELLGCTPGTVRGYASRALAVRQRANGPPGGAPSCPTAKVCVAAVGGLKLAVTTDGTASWSIEALPAPPGVSRAVIDQVSCATAAECVVHVAGRGRGTFLSTTNGGRSWTTAGKVPEGAPAHLWLLRCDPDGRCIGLYPTGTNTRGGLAVMRSADGGRSWALSQTRAPRTDIVMVSCGDGLHCMFLSDSGATMTTSDGGVTWQQHAAPRGWPDTATSVSCPAGLDCFVALADSTGVRGPGYEHPVIEATRNGGDSWTALSLPAVHGSPLVIVYPLSCPTPAGCIGIAATAQEFSGDEIGQRSTISSFPAAGRTAS